MKINIINKELNEFIAVNIIKWGFIKVPYIVINGLRYVDGPFWMLNLEGATPDNPPVGSSNLTEPPNYCKNLDLTYLMEDKIRFYSEIKWREYCCNLFNLIEKPENDDMLFTNHHFECYHASARIRCEAAYITFK